jgi:integrase
MDHFLNRWPDLALGDFTEEHIIGYIEEAGIRSRQHRRSCFHTLFTWAARVRRIEKNPMAHVPHYKQPQQEPVSCFTEAEVKTLIDLPEPDGTLMAVLFGAGIRKGEARHLTPRKIDFENGELHVVDGAKGGSVGVVPLSVALVHRLATYIADEGLGLDDYLWGCNPGGSFKRRHDRPLSDGGMQKWWKRAMESSGVEYRNLHTTRHTFATLLRRRGLAVDDVSDLLRHADPRTTRRVYVHLNAIDIRRRMEAQGVEAVA